MDLWFGLSPRLTSQLRRTLVGWLLLFMSIQFAHRKCLPKATLLALSVHNLWILRIFLDMTDKPLASILCVLCSVHCAELWSDDCSYSCRFSLLTQNVRLWQLCLLFRFIRLNHHESKNMSVYDRQASSLHTVCAVQCRLRRTQVGWLFLFMSI